MPLVLRDVPEDIDEIGWTKLARISFAIQSKGRLYKLLMELTNKLDEAKGTPSPDDRRSDELENLNFLCELAAGQLESLILIFSRLTDQVEDVFEGEGIKIDITSPRRR